jgi:hypothetical protein
MTYKLFAFDLDGTLLDDRKRLSDANAAALREMTASGAVIAFATGRLGSSVRKFIPHGLRNIALLEMNGAEVRTGADRGSRLVHSAPLPVHAADYLIGYGPGRPFAVNYYCCGELYAVRDGRTIPWLDLYFGQTGTEYRFVKTLEQFRGRRPSKIIFVGAPDVIDEQEHFFRKLWGESVYICRTWDHYLEFLDVRANKAEGLDALAREYGIAWKDIAAFGDAENDIPMLRRAGLGIAMANAPQKVREAAERVSAWTNNEDGVAKEWEKIKTGVSDQQSAVRKQ